MDDSIATSLSGQESRTSSHESATRSDRSKAVSFRFGRITWGLAFFVIGFELIDGFTMIRAADSAPQQAAAAAMACFYVIGIYALARSIDEVTRP